MPGIQSAMALPGQYQANEQLAKVNATLDIEQQKAIERRQKVAFAIRQYQEERDDARKARWAAIISKLAGAGIGFAIGGPAGAVAGAGIAGAAGQGEGAGSVDPWGRKMDYMA
jgi:hypothetical protein